MTQFTGVARRSPPQTAALQGLDGILFALLTLMIATAWAPKFASISEVNINVGVAALLFPLVAALPGGLSPRFATQGDLQASAMAVLAALSIIFLSIVSMFYAEVPFRAFRVIYGQFASLAIFAAVLATRADKAVLRGGLALLVICGVASSYVALAAYLLPTLRSSLFFGADRASGLFKNANQFGLALSLAIPPAVAIAVNAKRKLVPIFAVGSMFLGLILSGSKANLLISGVSLIVVVIVAMHCYRMLARRPGSALLLVGLLVVLLWGAYAALEQLNPRAFQILSNLRSGGSVASLQQRSVLWEHSFADAMDNPLTGVGAGQNAYGGLTHSHNVFLDFFRMLGLPGLVAVTVQIVAIVIVATSSLWRTGRDVIEPKDQLMSSSLAVSLAAYILGNQTSESFGPSTLPIFWFVFSLLLLHRRSLSGSERPIR